MMNFKYFMLILLLCCQPLWVWAEACDVASELVLKANKLAQEKRPVHEQKQLLQATLAKCPNHAEAHNNLGDLLMKAGEQNYPEAIEHFKQAISSHSTHPNLSEAWNNLGEVYFQQGQLPLSLETHLHACATDRDSKKRVEELLTNEQYRTVPAGKVFEQESLLILYDKQRRAKMEALISQCGIRAIMRPVSIFRSLTFFKPGGLELETQSQVQLQALVDALQQIEPTRISVRSYTTELNTTPKNLELAKNRAKTLKDKLSKQSVPSQCQNYVQCIQTEGFAQLNPSTVKQQIEIEAE